MNNILLLGAGFSRNWGGWLADEAFEYLLGYPEIDNELRNLLWTHKRHGGFESALAELQLERLRDGRGARDPRLQDLQNAVKQMFDDMNAAFSPLEFRFEFQRSFPFMVRAFLFRFNVIFTLNQDLLLEYHYLNENIRLSAEHPSWNGGYIPGMRAQNAGSETDGRPFAQELEPKEPIDFEIESHRQPYFKLHGSTNWISSGDKNLLVLGGNKHQTIANFPVLKWYHQQFRDYLSKPDTRLMVIGYSFGDSHINEAIGDSAADGNMRMFIIDPQGINVLGKIMEPDTTYMDGQFIYSDALALALQPYVMGASRRTLSKIFGGDSIEHHKVMRFFG